MIEIERFNCLRDISKDWIELYDRGREIWNYSPLQSYECATLQMHVFYRHPKRCFYKPVFFVARSDYGKAIIPLAINPLKKEVRDFFCFSPIDYTDIITDISDVSELMMIFQKCLSEYNSYRIVIKHFREDGIYSAIITQAHELECQKETCVHLNLHDKTYDSYYQSLSKHQRQNVRTAYNKLAKEHIRWNLVEYNGINPIPQEVFHQCQKIYEDRCSLKNQETGLINLIRKFIRRKANFVNYAIRNLHGSSIFVLYFEDEVVAYLGGYYNERKSSFYIPRLSTSEQFLKYSTGIILVNEIVRLMIENHVEIIDLTRGAEPYKYAMGGIGHFTYSISTSVHSFLR